ncbi:MAG: serine/threonine-protein kinase [Phycisphaerales bacterium]
MSTTFEHRGERALFLEALDLPAEARPAFVEQACSTNAGLRRRVLDLLAAHEAAGDYLAGAPSAHVDALLGTDIGPYTLVERLGEGGFGLVYAAEQRGPLRRTVALKLLKPGVDTAQVVARFEAERQALAMMDHPNIAKIFDAGTNDAGRPYFVMELVRGEPITTFCDRHKLTAAQRLELLIDVCSAVQHAHQKGVIHRDLKPSNVLVARHDGPAVAKVIDFGIAKAVGSALGERSIHTEWRQLIGTPAYMSPEQAGMDGKHGTHGTHGMHAMHGVDIDTRADIYALGVLLYELLTGAPPLDADRLLGAGIGEIQRLIREETPPLPSTRLTSLGLTASAVADARGTDVRRLHRIMRGDLDWIVMKAIEKDRSRRYESAAALAEDLRRHLRSEPVEAGPPSAGYRVAKFVRRHRVPVAAGAAIAAALGAGLALAVTGLVHASIERDAAIVACGRERSAREEADQRRHDAERMADAPGSAATSSPWASASASAHPWLKGRRDGLTAREPLDVASATIDRAYADAVLPALARQQLRHLSHALQRRRAPRAFGAARPLPRAGRWPRRRGDGGEARDLLACTAT